MRAIHLLPLLLFFMSFSDCDAGPYGYDIYSRLELLCNKQYRDQFFQAFFQYFIMADVGAEKYNQNTFSQAQLWYKCPHNQWEFLGSHLQTFRNAPAGAYVQMHLESLRVVNHNLIARLRFDGFGQQRKMVYDYELYIPQGHGWNTVTFYHNLRVLKIWTVC